MDVPIYKVYEINLTANTKIVIGVWTSLKKLNLWLWERGYHYDWWEDCYEDYAKDWKYHYLQVEEIWD